MAVPSIYTSKFFDIASDFDIDEENSKIPSALRKGHNLDWVGID